MAEQGSVSIEVGNVAHVAVDAEVRESPSILSPTSHWVGSGPLLRRVEISGPNAPNVLAN